MLLSGQDYPIKPLSDLKQYLKESQETQFIDAFALSEPNGWSEMGGPYQAMRRVMHWHFFFKSRHLHIPLKRTLPNLLSPYGGSQWWALTWGCVLHIMQYLDRYPNVINYFKYTFIPDELFFSKL